MNAIDLTEWMTARTLTENLSFFLSFFLPSYYYSYQVTPLAMYLDQFKKILNDWIFFSVCSHC